MDFANPFFFIEWILQTLLCIYVCFHFPSFNSYQQRRGGTGWGGMVWYDHIRSYDDPYFLMSEVIKLVISDREGQRCHFRKGVVNQHKRKKQQNHVIPLFFNYFIIFIFTPSFMLSASVMFHCFSVTINLFSFPQKP